MKININEPNPFKNIYWKWRIGRQIKQGVKIHGAEKFLKLIEDELLKLGWSMNEVEVNGSHTRIYTKEDSKLSIKGTK